MSLLIGEILGYAGATAPKDYLLCDGSAVSRATYAELFAIIGTSFGSGDGSTTFNLPNMQGKIAMMYKSDDASFDVIGETGGAKTINIAHSHTRNAHTHTVSGNTDAGDTATCYAGAANHTHGGHVHSYSGTTGDASDKGTNSQLSATQSILNPYNTINFIVRYKLSSSATFPFFAFVH